MAEKETNDRYEKERREARRESDIVCQIRKKADLSDARTALKIYNKSIGDKLFRTLVGYAFLEELRETIIKSGLVEEDALAEIPVMETGKEEQKSPSLPLFQRDKYQKLYEGQKLLNKKLKITVAALILLVIGFVVINFRFEYSIFTYFTDYKAKMEEELIDKYKSWETELQEREENFNEKK